MDKIKKKRNMKCHNAITKDFIKLYKYHNLAETYYLFYTKKKTERIRLRFNKEKKSKVN